MDPSSFHCKIYDSLKQNLPAPVDGDLAQWYSQEGSYTLTPAYDGLSINSSPPAKYTDPDRYQALQSAKDAFDNDEFIVARDAMNPFEKIGKSIFMNRAAVKIANTDAVHNVSSHIFTYDNRQSDEAFTFCDVAAGPGGFTQYLQYRFPNSVGYGMTLKLKNLDWWTNFLDMDRFQAFYGSDDSGNLYTNWEEYIDNVLNQQPEGVDLVMGDGGFDLEDTTDKTLINRQEFLSSRLLLTQSAIGVSCCKVGGNFVLKLFDTVTEFSAHVLFVLAQVFHKIQVFKPASSRPANAERYLVCMNRRSDVDNYYKILADAAKLYSDDTYLGTLFSESMPSEFVQWLIHGNFQSISRQLEAAYNILAYLDGENPEIQQYDISKFLVIWNLPDNIPRRRQLVGGIFT